MLLRRVIEHVKDQNWLAVFLDFLIVVVGVFIGIHVSLERTSQRMTCLGILRAAERGRWHQGISIV